MEDDVVRPGAWPTASAGECEMAVTAIDYGGRLVTVVSRRVERSPSNAPLQTSAFTTNIRGSSLSDTVWEATSWVGSLQNPANAVSRVVTAIETSATSDGQIV